MRTTQTMEISAAEQEIIRMVRSMKRGELEIIIRDDRPIRMSHILRYPEEKDDVSEPDGRTEGQHSKIDL